MEFLNWFGDLMVQEVVEGVAGPTRANRIMVDGEVAVFDQVRNLRFINRFGVTGRESLRAQTCWKECNRVVIEKRDRKKVTDRWTGARYGPRKDFEPYLAQAGIQMGFMDAEQTLFIADGARHNWELAMTHSVLVSAQCQS